MRLREKTTATLLIAIFMISAFANLPIFAAEEEEIEESIVQGLAWLAGQQNNDGSWGDWEKVAHTGLAVLKFIDRAKELGKDPFGVDYEYHNQVEEGLEYIFSQANTITIGTQPDFPGDGIGVYITDSWHDSYATGISLMAISAAKPYAPGPVTTGPLVGWTYAEVIKDTVDYLAFGQNDMGWPRGGWGYTHNQDWSDNSNTGWVTLGLGYAMASGETIPQFVLDNLNIWIDHIQHDIEGQQWDGGSGYTSQEDWVNMLKTGNLLYQMALVGDTVDTPRVIDAIDYQERHWNDIDWEIGWKGGGDWSDWAEHQTTFCIMKGFEVLGIDTITVDATEIDWFDEISTEIVAFQNPDGSWNMSRWGDDILGTTWALLTLQKVVEVLRIPVFVDIKPGSWPNPINKGSEGVFSAAICRTEEFDVMTIDPETVKIYIAGINIGVPALRWSYEDVATPYTGEPGDGHEQEGDGFMDLVLHFDTQEVVEVLELCNYDDETVPLIVRGNLDENGGTTIEGQDYVWLKAPKGKGKPEPQPPPTYEHPLEGMTIQIGMTSASTEGLENIVILADEIIEPKINEYVSGLGLDITFDFVVKDNEGNWETALENTQWFKENGIDLIIGHPWSSQCQGSLDYVNENDMLLLSGSSTAPILAIPDDRLFRTCPTDDVQGVAIAEMWETWGIEAVLTMRRVGPWADGIWNILEEELASRGIENLGEIKYPTTYHVTDFTGNLTEANNIIMEAISEYGIEKVGMQFISFAEFRNITIQAADTTHLLDIIWMGTEDGGRDQAMLNEAGEWAVQTRQFSSFMAVDEGSFLYQEFEEIYYEKTNYMPSFYTASQYDAAWLMVETILKTASIDPSVIADSLIPTSYMMHGISGWMALDENGDRMPQLFDIWGFYENPEEPEEYLFRKFGSYDGRIIDVNWYDADLEYYAGITRPGK